VDWLERVASDRVMEYEEIRGYHLEQTYLILIELAPLDDHDRQVGFRGSGYLASAGRRALARGDMGAASNLLRRAGSLLPLGDRERPSLFLTSAEATVLRSGGGGGGGRWLGEVDSAVPRRFFQSHEALAGAGVDGRASRVIVSR
jgi:hypothetical protein